MVYVIVLVLLVGVVWLVAGPLLRSGAGVRPHAGEIDAAELERSERRIDLEAARDAKYREIRDAELDHQTGKLSDQDFSAIDATLRAEAMDLLHQLDALDAEQAALDVGKATVDAGQASVDTGKASADADDAESADAEPE